MSTPTATWEQVQAFQGTREQWIAAGLGMFIKSCRCRTSSKPVSVTLTNGDVIAESMCSTCIDQNNALGLRTVRA